MGSPAPRVILISMMKSGTHLVKELMVALGYNMYGQVRVDPENRPALDEDAGRRIAGIVYGDEELARLKLRPEPEFMAAAERAWEALAWAWQVRFGMPVANYYGNELIDTGLVEQAYRRSAGSSFSDTPPGVCWTFHELDIKKIDGNFLREWTETGEPRIVFNYRDPRDVILSMVNFLSGQTKHGLSTPHHFPVFSQILLDKDSFEERLAYALTDTSFPCQGNDFRKMIWLLNHPRVCKVSFEELVGPDGGGSAEAQQRATARLIDFLGAAGRPAGDVAGSLYNRDAFSFYRGQIGAWRDVFTAEHRRLAEDRFADVLPLYGYERLH